MANPFFNGTVRVIGAEIVNAKLLMASPRILAHNRLLVGEMLKHIKPIVESETPIGPGHFGYHLRSSYRTDVKSTGLVTTGVLKAPAQGYWREYGTLGNFAKSSAMSGYIAALGGGSGERALFIAHKAANSVKRFIAAYYGGMAAWWRL